MILELDTTLFKIDENLSLNQLVFLTLCMNGNQPHNQDIHEFLSRISEADIQSLLEKEFIIKFETDHGIQYEISDKLKSFLKTDKTMFDEFYELYPAYVTRPDGTKGFLRANINKCRKEYNRIIGRSKVMHEHIVNCLKCEIDNKMTTGKLGYMKTMWKWITQHEWEAMEEEMQIENNSINLESYGATVY